MAHGVFISYSAKDKATADAACAHLEVSGVRCWIAPRDIQPGATWAGAIVDAIGGSRALVLVFSAASNDSKQVMREVSAAADADIPILPFRIHEAVPTKELGYFIGPAHWLDAITPPLEAHLARLCETVRALLQPARDMPREKADSTVADRPIPEGAKRVLARPKRSGWVLWAALLLILGLSIGIGVTLLLRSTPEPSRPVAVGDASTTDGARIYSLNCARCHGEDGQGVSELGGPRLKDSDVVVGSDPSELVAFVVGGAVQEDAPVMGARPRVRMPAWGPKLSNEQLIAVINHIRGSWGNRAEPLNPHASRPTKDLAAAEVKLVRALQLDDEAVIRACYADGWDSRFVRLAADLPGTHLVDVFGSSEIARTLRRWLTEQTLHSMSLSMTLYDENESKGIAYSQGTVEIAVSGRGEKRARRIEGRFIRMYRRRDRDDPKSPWQVSLDFATLPLPIGSDPPRPVLPTSYADVQRVLSTLGGGVASAPHGRFWDLPYDEFIKFKFPFTLIPGATIRLINLDMEQGITGAQTNLIKALRDGRDILVETGSGETRLVNIGRMPRNLRPLGGPSLDRLIYWLDHGMPR